jgi:hypothetical protein
LTLTPTKTAADLGLWFFSRCSFWMRMFCLRPIHIIVQHCLIACHIANMHSVVYIVFNGGGMSDGLKPSPEAVTTRRTQRTFHIISFSQYTVVLVCFRRVVVMHFIDHCLRFQQN